MTGAIRSVVPPGIHTLVVWLSHDLGPYSDWVPSLPIDRACASYLTVTTGARTTIDLFGQPAEWEAFDARPAIAVCLRDF